VKRRTFTLQDCLGSVKALSYPSKAVLTTAGAHALRDFRKFVRADQGNREAIMAEVKEVLVAWFSEGVIYSQRSELLGLPMPPGLKWYVNAPSNLRRLLQVASGQIMCNILRWRGVPGYLVHEVLMLVPAVPACQLAPFGINRELEADFGLRVIPLPYGSVCRTEGIRPERRADIVGNNWYHLEARRLYNFVAQQQAKIEAEGRHRSLRQIEKYIDLERELSQLGLDLANQVEYFACTFRDLTYGEVSALLATLGTSRSPGAVKKSYHRHRNLVRKQTEKSSGYFVPCQGGNVVKYK